MTSPMRLSVPRPRSIMPTGGITPPSALVNLQRPVGNVTDPTDYIGELSKRITGDIASARANANTDINALMARIKAQNANWKPTAQLGPLRISVRPGTPSRGGPVAGVKIGGGVDQWIAAAYRALGIPLTSTALAHERYLIQHESGGNPRAVNNWDSNAKRGTPSMGLAQTIMPTFKAYMLPGHGDIWNPVDNLIASLRYRKSRYKTYDIGNYKGGY